MPNTRLRRNSVVDMLSKVHVNRGSLLKSIENLLKTIESSESAVMIPTLLRDKCEFDAWELLFVAKILKASILGHSDLVEFYMNHMGHSAVAATAHQQHANGTNGTTNGDASSPIGSPGGLTRLPPSPSLSTASSISSNTTATSGSQQQTNQQQQQQTPTNLSRSQSSGSWMTANQAPSNQSVSSGSFSNATSVSSMGSSNGTNDLLATKTSAAEANPPNGNSGCPPRTLPRHQETSDTSALLAARPLLMRQAQPPSLLQLTTTNNHINSVAAGFSSNMESLATQLSSLAAATTNGNGQQLAQANRLEGALSISTTVANQSSAASLTVAGGPTTTSSLNGTTLTDSGVASYSSHHRHNHHHSELKTSRSAGCLFRKDSSGASSPRTPAQTPTTPCPQAETLANGELANGLLAADPSAPVKLLLQIEQLKTSINHVTTLLDSVVELYKKSIDNLV